MNKEIIEGEIDSCLAHISHELYNFHDEIVRLLSSVEYIEHLQRLRDKHATENHLH